MKRLLLLAALFVLAVPVAYAVPPAGSGPNPSQLCKEQLRAVGASGFQSLYAPNANGKNAFGKCVSWQSQLAQSAAKNAAKTCKTERGATAEKIAAFNEKYGSNANARNAFGKCVSMTARDLVEAQQDATLDAAAACKSERQQMGADAFKGKYGTNANKSNAFGKCIQKLKNPAQQP